jgi:hypothetical protein
MMMFHPLRELEVEFKRFERAAAKGHEESLWIVSVLYGVATEQSALREAFAKTGTPLGWYFAGKFCDWNCREQFDYFKKSAEGGCGWGQVKYGLYFQSGAVNLGVEKDTKVHLDWLETAAKQNNPLGLEKLGWWFQHGAGNDFGQAHGYWMCAAELGSRNSMVFLADQLQRGEGCEKDLRQAIIWGAKGGALHLVFKHLGVANRMFEEQTEQLTNNLDLPFDHLCFTLGWGLYWYLYDTKEWMHTGRKAFGEQCLDYYCSCIELQRKSIFTFLWLWNRMTGGVKDVGMMIGKMAWEEDQSVWLNQLWRRK